MRRIRRPGTSTGSCGSCANGWGGCEPCGNQMGLCEEECPEPKPPKPHKPCLLPIPIAQQTLSQRVKVIECEIADVNLTFADQTSAIKSLSKRVRKLERCSNPCKPICVSPCVTPAFPCASPCPPAFPCASPCASPCSTCPPACPPPFPIPGQSGQLFPPPAEQCPSPYAGQQKCGFTPSLVEGLGWGKPKGCATFTGAPINTLPPIVPLNPQAPCGPQPQQLCPTTPSCPPTFQQSTQLPNPTDSTTIPTESHNPPNHDDNFYPDELLDVVDLSLCCKPLDLVTDISVLDKVENKQVIHAGSVRWTAYTESDSVTIYSDVVIDSERNTVAVGVHNTSTEPVTMFDSEGNPARSFLPNTAANGLIVKYNNLTGNVVWATRITSENGLNINSVTVDSLDNIVVHGHYNRSELNIYDVDGNIWTTLPAPSSDRRAAFVIKYNKDGNVIWATRLDSLGSININAIDVKTDSNNNVIVTGVYSESMNSLIVYNSDGNSSLISLPAPSALGANQYIIKFDSFGTSIWASYIADITFALGLTIDTVDYITVMGYVTGNNSLTPLVKDSTGATSLVALIVAPNSTTTLNYFITKYSSNGVAVWSVTLNDELVPDISIYGGIDSDSNSNIVITSGFNKDKLTIYEPNTNTVSKTLTKLGSRTAFIAKFGPSGNSMFAAKLGGSGYDTGTDVATDLDNNIYVTGIYTSNPLTSYNSNNQTGAAITGTGNENGFLVKYSSTGFSSWITQISGSNTIHPHSVATDHLHGLAIVGGYDANPTTFFNSDGTACHTLSNSTGTYNAFVAVYIDYVLCRRLTTPECKAQNKTIVMNYAGGAARIIVKDGILRDGHGNSVSEILFTREGQTITLLWFCRHWNIISKTGVELVLQ